MAEKLRSIPDKFTYAEIEHLVFEFEKLMNDRSRAVPTGSKLEQAGLTAMQMLATYKKEISHNHHKDYRNEWRRALSMADVLRKVLSLQKYSAFDSIWPHLLLLLGNGETAQNLWSPKEDGDANKIFELYVALLALPLCSTMTLDHPRTSAGGRNPDIIAAVQGVTLGIACKVMHSPLAKSMLDRVREGIQQIKRCGDAQRGLVVVSLKNVIPHDLIWPAVLNPQNQQFIYFSYPDDEIPVQLLKEESKRYEIELLQLVGGTSGFRALFQGTNGEPLILAHLCTVATILRDGKPTFTLMKMLVAITVDPLPEFVGKFAGDLNEVLHDKHLVQRL